MLDRIRSAWKQLKSTKLCQFISLLNQDIKANDIFNHAYSMAYVTLFSLVPSLAAVFALISLFLPMFGENSSMLVEIRQLILKHLATGSGEQAIQYLENFMSNTDFKKIGMTGFAGMVITLTLLLRQIELALNRIFEIDNPRALFMRFVYFWTFLTLGTFSLAVSVGAISSTSWGSSYLEASLSLRILNDFLYACGLFILFFTLYKVVPNRFIPTKHAAIGGLIAATLFSLAVRFFSFYVNHLTSYQAIYGALAALPIFLFWLYVIWLITLLGASVTKRSMEGLYVRENHEPESAHHMQAHYLNSLLPFLTLVKIYEAFENNNGVGARAETIAHDLKVSRGSIRKCLHHLVNCELALASKSEEVESEDKCSYFPRAPLQNLNYDSVKRKLLGEEELWLQTTNLSAETRVKYQDYISLFLRGDAGSLAKNISAAWTKSS